MTRGVWLSCAALVAAVVGLVLWLASGAYVVAADQRGVVRRFGAVVAQVGPGMHYHMPWPIGRVDLVRATSVMQQGVGFALSGEGSETTTGLELLTGDTNILSVALVLQFVIRDPAEFLTQVADPRALIGLAAEGALTATVAHMKVDDVLTTGRLAIQNEVRRATQAVLDRRRSGIQITSANIMTISLDRSVAEAFQAVADAVADREKAQNEARSYANAVLPRARGEAAATIGEGRNYQRRRVAEATGDADRFTALAREYGRAPDVTRTRLYREEVEKILARAKLYIVDSQNGHVPLNLRLVGP